MPVNSESINRKLFDLLSVRGYDPKPLDVEGKVTPVPEEAAVIKFDFIKDGENYGKVWASIDGAKTLQLYYGDSVTNSPDDPSKNSEYDDTWTGLIKHLKNWAQRRQLGFDLKNENHLVSDMARRKHTESLNESDISGLLAASKLNRSFIITAQTYEGQTKKYRVKAQSPNVAKEKFMKHHSMAKVLDIKEEGVAEGSEQSFKVTYDIYGSNKEKPLYTKSRTVRANSEQEAISILRKLVGGTNYRVEKQGVAEGLVGDVVVHNYTKIPIDLKPGQAQIHGWGPNDQPIYRVKGADGKEVITSNKKKMMMVAQGQGVAEGSSTTWEVCFDYGPHMSETVKVKASSEEEAIAKVKKAAEKRGRSIMINWVKPVGQGVAEGKESMKQVNEGYYPMGKQGSYSDAIPTTKIILQHTRKIEEGEQRYRNIAKIFVENTNGERFLIPTTKPGIARVYARHIAEGGTPYDERGKHITSLVEEYSKMAGFVRATKNKQFNESAQQLVNEGVNHYQSLRETLHKMCGHRGYMAYFESYTPTLVEDGEEQNNLNELFVQETLDPRIESVMPILSRLHKKVSEMKEVGELADWAASLEEAIDVQEENTPLKDKEDLMARRKALQDILSDPDTAKDPLLKREAMKRKHDLEKEAEAKGLAEEIVDESANVPMDVRTLYAQTYAKFAKTAGAAKGAKQMAYAMVEKKYGKDMADKLKAYHNSNLDEALDEDMAEDLDANQKRAGQLGPTEKVGPEGAIGKLVGANESVEQDMAESLNEMDSEGYKGSRDDYEDDKGKKQIHLGPEHMKKAKDVAKDAKEKLEKSMDKAHKKEVKEGQEDLDAILRIIRK